MSPANQVMLQLLARYMYSNQVEVYAQASIPRPLVDWGGPHMLLAGPSGGC
jgi:hypothetical protein